MGIASITGNTHASLVSFAALLGRSALAERASLVLHFEALIFGTTFRRIRSRVFATARNVAVKDDECFADSGKQMSVVEDVFLFVHQ